MIGRRLTVVVLGALLLTTLAWAEDPKRFEPDEAKQFAQLLTEASGKLDNLPLKITPDVEKSTGLSAEKRGALVVPAAGLKVEALKKLDKEVVPLGLLYMHRVTLVVAEQAVAEQDQRTVEITVKEQKAKVAVMQLAAAKVADRLVLLIYTNGKAPAVVTTLVETDDARDHPLDIEARKAGDNQATMILTVLGRYRAAFSVAGQD